MRPRQHLNRARPINMARLCATLSAVLLLATGPAAHAFDMTSDAPVSVKADQARLDDKQGTATYQGNVMVRQAEARLNADKVVLFRDQAGLNRIEAYGSPAHYSAPATEQTPATDAQANEITYSRSDNQITFKKDAVIRQGEDLFKGDVIHYDTQNRIVTASGQGEGRVEMVIQPRSRKQESGQTDRQDADTSSQ